MKLKIIITLLILLFSIGIVNCEKLDEGSFSEYSFESHDSTITVWGLGSTVDIERIYVYQSQNYQSGLSYMYSDILDANFLSSIKGTYDSYNEDICIYEGAHTIATGKIGYYKLESGNYRVWLWFDVSNWDYTGTGTKVFPINGHTQAYYRISGGKNAVDTPPSNYAVGFAYYPGSGTSTYYIPGTYTTNVIYSFQNDYYTTLTTGMHEINYNRSITGYSTSSKIIISDSMGTELLNETSFTENTLDLAYFNDNTPYKLECENYEGTNFLDYLYFSIPDINCRIEVNDIEIGESINISYFNIDDLRNNPLKYGNSDYATCNINIQIIADRGYYEELIYQDLITDESDNIFYYSSDTLDNGFYYAQINKELGSLTDYAVRTSFIISEPSNYSIVVNPDNVYIGNNINIIYKSLNLSTISIYDNSSTLIKSYLNIQDEGQKIFQIPPDNDYNNEYPNWYVYLNDTGNVSNNLRFNFTVNWKVYIEIEPTPEPTESYYNVTIEENIDEIKDDINPIKELIFGISTIFVDNPDYNKDSVVDVNEISTWLNSLISIAIIIFLFILYTVYKRG